MLQTVGAICAGVLVCCQSASAAVLLQVDRSVPNAAIELWFRTPSAGERNDNRGICVLAATAIAASHDAGALSLADLIKGVGGRISIDIYPDIASVTAFIPAAQAPQVLAAMTKAYFAPAISADGLKAAQRDVAFAVTARQFDTDRMLHDLLLHQLFSGGPQHYSTLPASVSALAELTPADIGAFARRAFRAQNAVVSLAGDLDPAIVNAVLPARHLGEAMAAPFDSTLAPAGASTTASAYDPGIGLAWAGPGITDTRAATALDFIADYLFRGDSGVVAEQVDRIAPSVYLTGQFITLHRPGAMVVTIAGEGYQKIREAALDAVAKMAQPLDQQTFLAARNAFEYHILSDSQTLLSRADNAGWYTVEGNAAYAPSDSSGMYLKTADSLDAQFVAAVARKYLTTPTIVELVKTK